ncbi:MAG: N-acetylmuramoyl-L-alanine amidase [Holdemanella porci]|uniref:peptidoglycan recognition protein family protein n=1 Tax=Holdemanella porci TaxID=2652276 RepID=UPI00399630E9
MSYSGLATYCNRTSQHYDGRFGYKVCKITPHYMAAAWSGKQCADYFARNTRQASSNYCIGINGDIACSVDEENAAWTSSNWLNDSQSITIECGNINNVTGEMTQATWDSLVNLCVDICKRYGFRLNYTGNSSGSLTMHKMFAATSCPGAWLEARMPQLAQEVNARLDGQTVAPSAPSTPNTPSGEKYSVGTPICTNTLSVNCYGTSKILKGDWSGTIGRVIKGAKYPYRVDRNGVAIGWTNDAGIDTDPHTPVGTTQSSSEAIDQILHEGSYVTSVHMKIGNQGLKKIGDDLCCYLSQLGGWFPIRMVDKVPNSDGYNDNVLHTTNAVVYVTRIRVDAVNVQKNIVKIGGIWVDPTPLTEIA